MTLTPGENSRVVRWGNDLNPLMVIELRCTRWEGCLSGRT
jgi:hypothetical protein